MKILHINTTTEWRGGDMQMLTTYKLLNEYEDIQQMIFCPAGSKMAAALKLQNIPHETAFEKKKITLKFFFKVLGLVKNHKINILHAHDSYSLSIATLVTFFCCNVKVVYSRKRNNKIKNNLIKRIKYNTARITKIVCVSQAVKDIFTPILVDQSKAMVIYDGVDVDLIAAKVKKNILQDSFGIESDAFVIGNIAALTPQKDMYTFINTAEIILKSTDKKIVFVVVGDGKLKEALVDYARKNNIADNIIFTGFRSDVPDILKDLDLLLLSSETEGLPLVVFEAFASHVPVVSTNAGGVGEAVEHGVTGMISPIKDAQSLADNALKIIADTSLRHAIVDNAFKKVSDLYRLETMRDNYYKLYKSL